MKATHIQPADYLNQVEIPAGSSGNHAVEHFIHPAGKELFTANLRHAFMSLGTQKIERVVYDYPTKWHRLVYSGGIWMTDIPSEQAQHRTLLQRFEGHVLVGGLGLGLAANWLAKKKSVKSVTVVEISKDVIKLVEPYIKGPTKKVSVVQQDLFSFLKSYRGMPFDWAFYDIWQSDGEGTFLDTVIPLRELSEGHVSDTRVLCWNEDVMRGQIFLSLQTRFGFLKNNPEMSDKFIDPSNRQDKWIGWSMPFLEQVKEGVITNQNVYRMSQIFSQHFGRPSFDPMWKWALREVKR